MQLLVFQTKSIFKTCEGLTFVHALKILKGIGDIRRFCAFKKKIVLLQCILHKLQNFLCFIVHSFSLKRDMEYVYLMKKGNTFAQLFISLTCRLQQVSWYIPGIHNILSNHFPNYLLWKLTIESFFALQEKNFMFYYVN